MLHLPAKTEVPGSPPMENAPLHVALATCSFKHHPHSLETITRLKIYPRPAFGAEGNRIDPVALSISEKWNGIKEDFT
ncbi:hypothetical protein YDYSG_69260 [Paenibacillus tyrfis]|nr:hypothetical protein YDYSG_69260 [Paenibacillus tyrfis]